MEPSRSLIEAGLGFRKANILIRNGQLVNVLSEEIYDADVAIYNSKISAVGDVEEYVGPKTKIIDANRRYLVPGLIDGHIHFEVSKLSVTMFAKLVLPFGTTSIVTGLDQIFGIAGLDGVRQFLEESKKSHLKLFFAAPSKLPYTIPKSTLRYEFGPSEHEKSIQWHETIGVWETVTEFVLGIDRQKFTPDKTVWRALQLASRERKPVFGCAPMLTGPRLAGYVCAGVRCDHECYSAPESLEKLRSGLRLMIRESSVVHFFDENVRIVTENHVSTRRIGFCTDDVTATDVLKRGHLDNLVRKAIRCGVEPIKAIQMATLNCAEIYQIDDSVGSISPGRFADILFVENLADFRPKKVIANGVVVSSNGEITTPVKPPTRRGRMLKSFRTRKIKPEDITIKTNYDSKNVRVLSMQISKDVPFVRKSREVILPVQAKIVPPSPQNDVLYVSVTERHTGTGKTAVAFISGFKIQTGAIASSLSPDDNNIISIGATPADMARAIHSVVEMNGGQVVVHEGATTASLPLPIGGIVADVDPKEMSKQETELDEAAKKLGSNLESPFMTMIFLSITAIPDYAITDKGLVDCVRFKFINPIIGPA